MRASPSLGLKLLLASVVLWGCDGDEDPPTGPSTGAETTGTATGTGGEGAGSSGGAGGEGGTTGEGGGGGEAPTDLEDLLERLRADTQGTLLEESYESGWPVRVDEGRVVVSTDPALGLVAGDFDAWVGTALTADEGFSWLVMPDEPGARYKLTDGADVYVPDPWARAYGYDEFGEISAIPAATPHLERFFQVGDAAIDLDRRVVRVWLPEGNATHVMYVHDGQNLFDPGAPWGGWNLAASAPAGMMIVGIDNTPARMEEYTHVADGGTGGDGDTYAGYVEEVVRPLVADQYGEPAKVGVMGSSLGGLISLHIATLSPGEYDFAASLSGTLGWGSFGTHTGETMIERYEAEGVQPFVVFLDSGGNGPCADTDGDGIFDDGDGTDNYCETVQMRDTLAGVGYTFDVDLHHWHEPGAQHNEAAWAARVFRPLDIFAGL